MQQTAPDQPRLDYAPPPPPRWTRRRVSRLLAAVLLLLAAGAAVRQYGPRVLEQVKMLYHQRQCLNYEGPPDQVVYEEDPAAVEAMAGREGYNMLPDPSGRPASMQAYVPTCWQRFQAEFGATLFLHERHAGAGGNGPPRLVAVERLPGEAPPFAHPLGLQVSVIAPVGLTGTPSDCQPPYELKRLLRTARNSGFPSYIQGPPVRFYAGQADPADPSHFTIRYAIGGQSGTVDGWLQADDTVRIQIRDGPAKGSVWDQVVH